MNINEVSEQIKKGLSQGYKQNLLLLSSYNDLIDEVQEYLLTVNVAQQLLEWNAEHHYKIHIEYPILNFYNNAFPSYKMHIEDIFNMAIISRQAGHSPTNRNSQKVDIAITEDQDAPNASTHERVIVGIELKGINKSKGDIKRDARRLSKAMQLEDPIDENSIKYCFCGFLRRLERSKDLVTDDCIKKKTKEEKKEWDKVSSELSAEFSGLSFSFELFDVVSTPFEVIRDIHSQMESDFSEVANATGAVFGGLIIIEKK